MSSRIFFRISFNQQIQNQTFTRVKRLRNSNDIVYFFEYYIERIIVSQQVIRNLKKCISKIVIYLNIEIVTNDEIVIVIDE